MDADGVEELLLEEFSEFLGPIDPVHKDDGLVESKGVQEVGQLFKLLVLG